MAEVIIPPYPASRLGGPHKHMIPPGILRQIGYDGWAVLSWALHKGWLQDHKLRFSQSEGRDVGVPETVRRMMEPKYMDADRDSRAIKDYLSKGASFNVDTFHLRMIEGYLLGTDFVSDMQVRYPVGSVIPNGIVPDEHGINQLEGELRRYWAQEKKLPDAAIRNIPLDERVLDFYIDRHAFYGYMPHSFGKKLNLRIE